MYIYVSYKEEREEEFTVLVDVYLPTDQSIHSPPKIISPTDEELFADKGRNILNIVYCWNY